MTETEAGRGGRVKAPPIRESTAGDFKICPCGIHYDGPGSLCPVCVRREERDLRELEKLDRSIIGETARCRPANENRLRGLP